MNKSFTLIEILVVIVVIGILSAFILVGMSSITSKANIAKGQAFINSIDNALLLSRVSYWKFDEATGTVANDSWSTRNGTLSGSPTPTIQTSGCVSNNCLSFNGSSAYVNCGDFAGSFISDPSVSGAMTVSVWSNVSGTGGSGDYIISSGAQTGSRGFYIYYNGGSPVIGLKNGLKYWTIALSLVVGRWTNIVFTWDGTTMKYYKDGAYVSQNTGGSEVIADTQTYLHIGKPNNASCCYFNGLIDDVKIYSQAIPTSEIQSNYFVGINKLYKNNGITLKEFNQRIVELKSNLSENE